MLWDHALEVVSYHCSQNSIGFVGTLEFPSSGIIRTPFIGRKRNRSRQLLTKYYRKVREIGADAPTSLSGGIVESQVT